MEQNEKRWESINFAKKIEAQNRYGFTIVFNGTDENVETHKRFIAVAKRYDGVFISALRMLLDESEKHNAYDLIIQEVRELENEVNMLRQDLEAAGKEPKKKELKMFGGE